MNTFLIILAVIITIVIHELSHLIAALLCKLDIEYVSIGFGKPYFSFKINQINFRITPWLIGGEVRLKGETINLKDGFLQLPYRKKVFIALAGVFTNLLLSLCIYLFIYQSVIIGILIDTNLLISIFTNNYNYLTPYGILLAKVPLFLMMLAFLNSSACIFNLIPFPALDGSIPVFVWLEKIFPANFDKILTKLNKIGFILLIILQIAFIVILLLNR